MDRRGRVRVRQRLRRDRDRRRSAAHVPQVGITKEKATQKIDVVVALPMVALGAVRGQSSEMPLTITLARQPITELF